MGLLVAYLLGIFSAVQSRDHDRKYYEAPPPAGKCQFPPDGAISVVSAHSPPSKEEYAKKKEEAKRKTIKFWVNIATLVVLAVYTGFTILIWCSSKKSADAAKGAADVAAHAQRPWVGLINPFTITDLDFQQGRISAIYTMKNFGNGPALKVNYVQTVVLPPYTLEESAKSICATPETMTGGKIPDEWKTLVGSAPKNALGTVLFPSQESHGPVGTMFQPKDFPKVEIIYFVGCVAYRDGFTEHVHWTRWCLGTPNRVGAILDVHTVLIPCALFNDTDDYYP